jgi:hypothetical protein
MIYNESLTANYGVFNELGSGSTIQRYRPSPTIDDYNKGYINRYFVKKVNENIITEISYQSYAGVNKNLYKPVELRWKISGPKNNIYKNGVLDKAGVTEQNKFEIERVKKEDGVDLSSALPNLLEYWRGR